MHSNKIEEMKAPTTGTEELQPSDSLYLALASIDWIHIHTFYNI